MRNVHADASRSAAHQLQHAPRLDDESRATSGPCVSVVVPAYNEAEILAANLTRLCDYLDQLEDMYRWEVIVVNDGSTDDTGPLADAFAEGAGKCAGASSPDEFPPGPGAALCVQQLPGRLRGHHRL